MANIPFLNNAYFSAKVGIGTDSPDGVLEVVTTDANRYVRFKAPNGEERFQFYTGGTGNASALYMYTSDGTTKNVQISAGGTSYFNAGNVGIGTTSPDRELEVEGNGNVYIRVTASTDADSSAIELKNTQETWTIRNDDTNDDALEFQSDSGTQVTILKAGNVGIGTTSPGAKLEVYGSSPNILINNTAETDSGIVFTDAQAGTGQRAAIKFSSSDQKLKFFVNDEVAQRMVIDTVGNVGIGTTNPTSALGSTKVLDISSTGNGEVILDHTDAGTASDLGLYSWARNNDHLAHIKASCDGSTSAAFISFHAQPSGGSFSNASSNERMRIKSNGNVGIGTTFPLSILDVNGVVSNGAANNDPNFTVSTTGMSKTASGSLQFTQGFSGTSSAGDRVVFTYQATSWKSWSLDYTFTSASGLVKGTIGGYNNNSGGYNNSFLINNMNLTAVATNFGQSVIVTFTGNFGIHMTCDMRYSQGGGDGAPRSDRAVLNYIS